jgi:D-ribose pyranase
LKKLGILNKDISEVIAGMGHTDRLTICDAGLPIPDYMRRIDLAIKPNFPRLLDVVEAVANDLQVQQIILAQELRDGNHELDQAINKIFSDTEILYVPHEEFKEMTNDSRAIIRTGECTSFANIILVSGVIF